MEGGVGGCVSEEGEEGQGNGVTWMGAGSEEEAEAATEKRRAAEAGFLAWSMGAVEHETGEHAAELPGLNLCLAGDGFLLCPYLFIIFKSQKLWAAEIGHRADNNTTKGK